MLDLVGALGLEVGQILLEHLKTPKTLNMALLVRVLKDGEMNKHQIFGEDKI